MFYPRPYRVPVRYQIVNTRMPVSRSKTLFIKQKRFQKPRRLLCSTALAALVVGGGALLPASQSYAQSVFIDGVLPDTTPINGTFPSPFTLTEDVFFDSIIFGGDGGLIEATNNERLLFSSDPADATISAGNGTHTISAPILINGSSRNIRINEGAVPGTLILSGANSLDDVELFSGTLSVQNDFALSAANLTIGTNPFFEVPTLDFADGINTAPSNTAIVRIGGSGLTLNQSGGTATFTGGILNSDPTRFLNLFKTGAGTLILTANNSGFSGPVLLDEGRLGVANNNALGTGAVSGRGGGLLLDDGITLANRISVFDFSNLGTGLFLEVDANESAILTGDLSGSGRVEKTGRGTVVFSNNMVGDILVDVEAGTLRLDGATFDAAANLEVGASGTLDINNGFSLGTTSTLINDGTVDIADGQTVAFGAITNNSGTITVGNGSTLQGVGNTLNNSSIIDVIADGTVTDAGDINNLSSGIINFNGPGGTAMLTSGGVITNDGAINLVSGGLTITGDLTNQGSGTFDIQAGSEGTTTTGSVTNAGTATLTANNTFTGLTSLTQTAGTINGASSITTTGVFTQSGGTTGGMVDINAASFTQSGGATVAAGTSITSAGAQTLQGGTIAGTLDGAGAITVETGTTALDGGTVANAASLTINSGALNETNAGSIDTTGDVITLNGGSLSSDGNAIADDEAVTVNEAGTLTLSGSETIASLAGSGSVNVNGATTTLTTGDANNTAFSGVIAGSGALTKQGVGTFTLSAANTFAGTTTINAGTLDVTGSLASTDIDINAGGTLQIGSASIAESSNVAIAAGSTLSLTGDATFNTVNGAGNVSLDANTLTTGDAGSNTIGGVISGSGGLVKQGSGMLTLSGANTFTGDTIVNAGILALSGGAALADTSDVFLNGTATLTLNGAETVASLTQTGGTINGTSSITTSGAFTQSGGATLAANTTVTSAGAQTLQGGTIAGTLDGTGAVVVETGTTSLTGTIANAASFTFNSGSFVNNGIVNPNAVLKGGLLSGVGTFNGSVTANAGSTIAPGNSIGTINTGDLSLGSGSTLVIEVSEAGADQVNVAGTVAINGANLVLNDLTPMLNDATQTLVIINNDGSDAVTGSGFGTITDNLAFLIPDVTLSGGDGNDIEVSFTLDLDLQSAVETDNQSGAAAAFTSLNASSPEVNEVLTAFIPLTSEAAEQGLTNLSGEGFGAANFATNTSGLFVGSSVVDVLNGFTSGDQAASQQTASLATVQALALAPGETAERLFAADLAIEGESAAPEKNRRNYVFSRGLFRDVQVEADGNGAETDVRNRGFVAGAGIHFNERFSAGVGAGYLRTDVNIDSLNEEIDGDGVVLNTHARFNYANFDLSGTFGYVYNDFDSERVVTIGVLTQTASADFDAHTGYAGAEIGYTFLSNNIALRPFVGGSVSVTNREAFLETGAGAANLNVAATTDVLGQFNAGVSASTAFNLGSALIIPRVEAAVDVLAGDLTPATTATFSSGGLSFTSSGTTPGRARGRVSAGFASKITKNLTGFLNYQGIFSSNDREHAVRTGLRLRL